MLSLTNEQRDELDRRLDAIEEDSVFYPISKEIPWAKGISLDQLIVLVWRRI